MLYGLGEPDRMNEILRCRLNKDYAFLERHLKGSELGSYLSLKLRYFGE